MIFNFFLPKMEQLDLLTCGCNKTGPHALLRGEFDEHFISSRSWPVNSLSRSCKLKLLDNFLWSHVKTFIYRDKPASIDTLEDNIEAFIREIPVEMLERVGKSMPKFH